MCVTSRAFCSSRYPHLSIVPGVCSFVRLLDLLKADLSLKRYWWGPGSQEVGERRETIHTRRHTVTTRMTPALRWAAMRAIIFNVSLTVRPAGGGGGGGERGQCGISGTKSQDSDHRPQLLKRELGEPKGNRTEVLLLTSLTPSR